VGIRLCGYVMDRVSMLVSSAMSSNTLLRPFNLLLSSSDVKHDCLEYLSTAAVYRRAVKGVCGANGPPECWSVQHQRCSRTFWSSTTHVRTTTHNGAKQRVAARTHRLFQFSTVVVLAQSIL
jgi:hypothetical protein